MATNNNNHCCDCGVSMGNARSYLPFTEAVEICDALRKPVNRRERAARIAGKSQSELYPYYGATGQVGFIDGYITDGEYVLLGEDGAPFLDAYAPKAYLIHGKTWVNNHAHVLRSKTNNKFLCYYLNSLDYSEYVSGTTRLKLTQAELKRIPVPVPELSEQERIVAKIEELFSELDHGVETLEKTKQQLAVYRQTVLKEAFAFSQGKTILACDIVTGNRHSFAIGPFGSDLKVSDYTPEGVPLVFVRDIRNHFSSASTKFISPDKAKQLSAHQVKRGDLLVTKMGDPPGDCCIYPFDCPSVITADCIKMEIDGSIILPVYAMYFIQSVFGKEQIKTMTQGVAQKKISLGRFKGFVFKVPNVGQQKKIVSKIEACLSVCDSIEKTVDIALQEAEAMRQGILKKAFEGGI